MMYKSGDILFNVYSCNIEMITSTNQHGYIMELVASDDWIVEFSYPHYVEVTDYYVLLTSICQEAFLC